MTKKFPLQLWFLGISVIMFSGCISAVPESAPNHGSESIVSDSEFQAAEKNIGTAIREMDEMVQLALPGGTYLRGSTEEGVAAGIRLCQQHYQPCNSWYYERENPQHEVTLSPFIIDQHEVTNQQFQNCVEAGFCSEPLQCKKGEPTYLDPLRTDHPVVCVNWEEAQNYCEWVGGRLPTEAEWEYAFRGEESYIYPWGNEFDGTNLNYCDVNCIQKHADSTFDDGYEKTAPAGSFSAGRSWAGLENLGGNVSEWVSDWYGDYGPETIQNPAGPETGTEKLIKGCSWYSPSAYCRGATRGSVDPGTSLDYLGFRCVSNAPPVIDGILHPGEWDQANLVHFEDGSELYLLQSEEYLYLAVRANPAEMIAGNVFINEGDLISILHTSAALGTAVYQKDGSTWEKIQDFEWCCRSRTENEEARADRVAFFDQEGWMGINSFLGNENVLEYKIRLTGSEEFIAVNFLRADNPAQKQIWPIGLIDGPAQPSEGGFPETMEFSPDNWQNLEDLP